MKRHGSTLLSIILILLGFLFIHFSCSQKRSEESRLFRFVDHFERENIIHSPFGELIGNFESVEEDLTGHWQTMEALSGQENQVWAAPTKHKILGYDETQKPEGMVLIQNGIEINFQPLDGDDRLTWKWYRGNRSLPAINLQNYKRKLKCSLINSNNPVEFSQLLPGGMVEFEVIVKKRQAKAPVSRLELYLDNRFMQAFDVDSLDYKTFRFNTKVELHNYAVKLATSKNVLHVKKVKINTANDLILLSIPNGEVEEQGNVKSELRYPSQKLRDPTQSSYSQEYLVSLLEEDAIKPIPDLGVTSSFPEIKKKAVFEDLALNSLLAPPASEFRFEVEIPKEGVLDFGYGILENSWDSDSEGVNFRVSVSDPANPKSLFSHVINPARHEEHRRLMFEKIDLADYAGKKIDIRLVTETLSSPDSDTPYPAQLAFWYNPVIFSKKSAGKRRDKDKLNVILISLDTLRWDRMGCYGYDRELSPHIDKLAEDGVQFSNCFAQSNWTLPSHVSMLTSLNCYRHQVYRKHEKMSASLVTIADILRVHDYYSGGITGGGFVSEQFGFSKGFDDYKGERYVFHAENEAEELGNTAISWLERNADKKFFLFLHTYQIHDPYYNHPGITDSFVEGEVTWQIMPLPSVLNQQTEKRKFQFTEKERADIVALYDGEIKYTDEYFIKPVIEKLKELNLYDRTLIILTSDHGEEFMDHESWLHGHTLYNELIKVPLIIKYPESMDKGRRVDTIVRSIDIAPTILEAAGIDASPFDMDGKSVQRIVLKEEDQNRTYFSDFSRGGSSELRPTMVCTNQDFYKFILNRKSSPPKILLFDLTEDKQETNNLEKTELDRERRMFQSILEHYDNFKEVAVKSDKIVMDKALEEKLRALGYIR